MGCPSEMRGYYPFYNWRSSQFEVLKLHVQVSEDELEDFLFKTLV